jgi:hypothetical protein
MPTTLTATDRLPAAQAHAGRRSATGRFAASREVQMPATVKRSIRKGRSEGGCGRMRAPLTRRSRRGEVEPRQGI